MFDAHEEAKELIVSALLKNGFSKWCMMQLNTQRQQFAYLTFMVGTVEGFEGCSH